MKVAASRWHREHTLVVLATLLAACVRFWHLSSLPPQAWDDEVWFATRARDMLQDGVWHTAYPPMGNSGNAGLVYSTALTQWLGIHSLVSARVSVAVASLLAVPLAYACFRGLLRGEPLQRQRGIAALAAVVMACLPCLIVLARVGMEPGLIAAVNLLAIWQLERGLRRRSWIGWIAAGLTMGLSQYYGLHARFVLPLAAYLLVDRFISQPGGINPSSARFWSQPRRAIIGGSLAMLVAGTLACLPLISTFVEHPTWLTDRASSVTQITLGGTPLENLRAIGSNATTIASSFFIRGDPAARHNSPGSPLLDPIQAAGFLVGVGWAASRIRRSALARILLVWLLLMAIPSVLSDYPPNFERLIGVTPSVAALTALGWIMIYGWLFQALTGKYRLGGLAPYCLVASMAWDVFLVFGRWAYAPQFETQFNSIPYQVARGLAARAAGEPVYVEHIPVVSNPVLFQFVLDTAPVRRVDFHECLPLVNRLSSPASYVVLTSNDSVALGKLSAIYPSNTVPARDLNLWQEGYMSVLEVPAGASVPLPKFHPMARFSPGIDLFGYELSQETFQAGQALSMSIYWAVRQPIKADLTPFIHIVPAGAYDQSPSAQHDGPPCAPLYPTSQWQTGEVILDSFDIPLPADLPPGEYEIAAGWYDPATMTRAALADADAPLPDGRAVIGKIEIVGP